MTTYTTAHPEPSKPWDVGVYTSPVDGVDYVHVTQPGIALYLTMRDVELMLDALIRAQNLLADRITGEVTA